VAAIGGEWRRVASSCVEWRQVASCGVWRRVARGDKLQIVVNCHMEIASERLLIVVCYAMPVASSCLWPLVIGGVEWW
jgi:hypothetical protein